MIEKVIKFGHIKIVIMITTLAILSSIFLYIPIGYIFEGEVKLIGIVISIIIPGIVTPLISAYMIKYLLYIHELEQKMRTLVTYDELTEVMSRRAFLENADNVLKIMKRDKSSLGLLYLDIDYFKKINDTYGHSVGDAVLKDFGTLLKENKRESDFVGRLGGEEFAFVLPLSDPNGCEVFANNIRQKIEKRVCVVDDLEVSYTVSIGVSSYTQESQQNIDELIKEADSALYQAKESGRNCTVVYK